MRWNEITWGLLLLFLDSLPVPAEEGTLARILSRSYQGAIAGQIIGRSARRAAPPLQAPAPVPQVRPPLPAWVDQGALTRVRRYDRLIEQHSQQHRLDPDLVRAVIYVESGGDPLAISRAGAAGLMQLMPLTAAELGVGNRFDPEENIASGTRYLRALLDRFHSTEVALWAYNAGPEAVTRGSMPSETRRYVPQVLRLRRDLKLQTTGPPEN